jgi:hypothetical protein
VHFHFVAVWVCVGERGGLWCGRLWCVAQTTWLTSGQSGAVRVSTHDNCSCVRRAAAASCQHVALGSHLAFATSPRRRVRVCVISLQWWWPGGRGGWVGGGGAAVPKGEQHERVRVEHVRCSPCTAAALCPTHPTCHIVVQQPVDSQNRLTLSCHRGLEGRGEPAVSGWRPQGRRGLLRVCSARALRKHVHSGFFHACKCWVMRVGVCCVFIMPPSIHRPPKNEG